MTVAIDVSLLVCTRNRRAALTHLLDSLSDALAAAAGLTIEIVIVDNGSDDDTVALVERWRRDRPAPVVLLHEPRPGLARARNRALAAARGAIIALTDDDCRVERDYFTALTACFAEQRGPAVIGGRILPGDPRDLPVTLKTEDHPMIAAPSTFPGGFVMGANLAMSAAVPARVGDFDERFGAGAPFVAAEDTDFLFRAMRRGIPVRYDPRFTVRHFHGRRAPEEEISLLAGYSFGDGALYAKHIFRDRRVATFLWKDVKDLVCDVRDPVTVHRGIARFYRFRLRHKCRGMIAYAGAACRRALRRSPAAWRTQRARYLIPTPWRSRPTRSRPDP
ncbi:MAG: glycosyltransferase [Sphingomonas adhaesiva]|uniref:glycosyltransferase family 2 protein n=1 Tax=Sphingomonas adhaesiva TaxID=28212 RepID=UPI002FF57452